jgi:RimJ/RimL family protein N-acetyltransferase
MHHLALQGTVRAATLLIDPGNRLSLGVAERTRFSACGAIDGQRYFNRAVPPLSYTDGTVTLRCQTPEDVDTHLESVDDEQIDWLWLPGHRQAWETMTTDQQRAHTLRGLQANQDNFGRGPKWTFSVDSPGADYVVYIDCDLANDHVPPGEANISYTAHPAHRSKGYVTRSVRLVCAFLTDHTATRHAYLIIDSENLKSLRVARSIGAVEVDRWCNDQERTMIRHLLNLTSSSQ